MLSRLRRCGLQAALALMLIAMTGCGPFGSSGRHFVRTQSWHSSAHESTHWFGPLFDSLTRWYVDFHWQCRHCEIQLLVARASLGGRHFRGGLFDPTRIGHYRGRRFRSPTFDPGTFKLEVRDPPREGWSVALYQEAS